jgi:hypothetical protein
MSKDRCRPVEVDGEVIRVLGGREMNATDREAFADIVRAAKRRFAKSVPVTAAPSDQGLPSMKEGPHA